MEHWAEREEQSFREWVLLAAEPRSKKSSREEQRTLHNSSVCKTCTQVLFGVRSLHIVRHVVGETTKEQVEWSDR